MGCSDNTKDTFVKLAVDIIRTLLAELAPLLMVKGSNLSGRELDSVQDARVLRTYH